MQCYEGLDETKALYEWEYAKQMLYTQLLRDKLSEVLADAGSLGEAADRLAQEEDVFFSERFLLARPLLRAIRSEEPAVLLIDEIDRTDPEFEAFLLEVLSDFQVSIPELGTLQARHIPGVLLTSNNTRELSEALKRRCLYLFIDYPDAEAELRIVRLKVPDLAPKLARDAVGPGAAAARAGPEEAAQRQRDPGLGQGAADAQRRQPGQGHRGQHPDRPAQARGRHPTRPPRPLLRPPVWRRGARQAGNDLPRAELIMVIGDWVIARRNQRPISQSPNHLIT